MSAIMQVYVQAKNLDERARKALAALGHLGLFESPGSDWALLEGQDEAHELGRRASDIVNGETFSIEGHTSAMGYDVAVHQRGETVRSISQDGSWRVSGKPQPWEAALFMGDDVPEEDDALGEQALSETRLVDGAYFPIVRLERLLRARGLPEAHALAGAIGSGGFWREKMIAWIAIGVALLALEGLFLERSSVSSSIILLGTLVPWVLGIKYLQKKNGGRSITGG